MLKKLIIIFGLICILILAILLRSRIFFTQDFYLLVDQARDLLLVKGIVLDHDLTLIGARTGMGGIFHGPLWLYMIAPFFFIFQGDPFLTLVPLFLIVSLSLIISGFFVGWRLYNAFYGLLFAFLLTLSATLIESVLFTSNAQLAPIVVLFYIYTTIKYIRTGNEKYFIFSLFFIGLGFQFESAFAFLLIFLTAFAILLRKKLPKLKNILLGIIALFIPISTFIVFDLRHNFLMTSSFIKLITSPIKPLEGFEKYSNFSFRVVDRITAFFNSYKSPLFEYSNLTYILLIIIILSPIFILIYNYFKKKKIKVEKDYIFILFSPIFIFTLYIFYPLPLWPHYLFPISIFIIMLVIQSIRLIYNISIFKYLVILFLVMLTLPSIIWIKNSYLSKDLPITKSDGSYKNQLNVANWVTDDAQNKEYSYFVYTPGILTYNMDYLMWWLNYRKNLKTPSKEKVKSTYLILYPHDKNDNDAHNYWKKNVIKTNGEVILRKKFNGGIIVEKLNVSNDEEEVDLNYFQNLIFR